MFFQKIQKSRDWLSSWSPKQSQSRPMGGKSLGLLRLGQQSLRQSRDFELWDSSPRYENRWDWQFRPLPISDSKQTQNSL